jgi:hypothetical protein
LTRRRLFISLIAGYTGAIICLKETHEYKEYGVLSPISPFENDSLAGLFFVYRIVSPSSSPYNAEAG